MKKRIHKKSWHKKLTRYELAQAFACKNRNAERIRLNDLQKAVDRV